MSDLISCFERLIHHEWLLERNGGEWLLRETQAGENQHSLLRIHGGPALAFSLDDSKRFPFLNPDKLHGICGICDAMVLVQKDDRAYALAIEMKTKDEGKAVWQIENARLFLEWLFGLLELHGHWRGEYRFCGIISFKPRRQERKGSTARTPLPEPEPSRLGSHKYPIFRLYNHPRLNVIDVLERLN